MQRILEPELMDTQEEATEYDAMDFREVNHAFAREVIELVSNRTEPLKLLDVGTGTARIPILISQQRPQWQIKAIDMAGSMLEIGQKNVADAGLEKQIILEFVDAKQMPYPDANFDLVISNSLVHHLPNPLSFFQEIARVLKPKGAILIRDLIRPESESIMNAIVDEIGLEYDDRQKQLFRDSLHAAFTLDEIAELIQAADLQDVKIYQSSDRHWTAKKEIK
jgi:ubiquinone/menaquinone biosynthesis C-methylase UbiE